MRILQFVYLGAVMLFFLVGIPLLVSFALSGSSNVGYIILVGLILLGNIALIIKYLAQRKRNK